MDIKNAAKIKVLDKRTDNNISFESGDLVHCMDCGRVMLVNIGWRFCPMCGQESLRWEDEEEEEVDNNFFENSEDYELIEEE